jgi:uncharacterized membrane protein HdeD (DUF308 family)
MMDTQLTRNWWVVALRGVLAIVFGILTFMRPSLTLQLLVLFFGAYVLMDGIFALIAAWRNNSGVNHWWLLLEGIVSIAAGGLTFFWPGVTAIVLLYLIAGWAVVTGILEILAAVELRKTITNEWLLIFGGLLSVFFGVVIAFYPGTGVLTIIWLIGFYAVFFGVMLLGLALRLRNRHNHQPDMTLPAGHTA